MSLTSVTYYVPCNRTPGREGAVIEVVCDGCGKRARLKGRGLPMPEGWGRDRRDKWHTWHTCPRCWAVDPPAVAVLEAPSVAPSSTASVAQNENTPPG